jgi:hypothetical protein
MGYEESQQPFIGKLRPNAERKKLPVVGRAEGATMLTHVLSSPLFVASLLVLSSLWLLAAAK